MKLFRRAFDRLTQHEFSWASTLFRLAFWWTAASSALIVFFYAAYRLKNLVAAVPPVIQIASVLLIAIAVLLMFGMFRERGRALAAFEHFLSAFADVKAATEEERTTGISQERMLLIRRKTSSLPGKPKEWWRALEESMAYYTSPSGEQGWFLTRPVMECLPEDETVESFYHYTFHQAVPGILTALGLLATFVAILMALAGVTYDARDPLRPVSGIDQLINGLSGKFLSSIIALVLSVVFTLLEKKVCDQQLRNGHYELIRRLKSVFPLLTQSRILLDIQRIALGHALNTRVPAASERD